MLHLIFSSNARCHAPLTSSYTVERYVMVLNLKKKTISIIFTNKMNLITSNRIVSLSVLACDILLLSPPKVLNKGISGLQ